MNGRSATESKLVIQLCLVKVDRSQNDLTVYHTKSITTCDYMYVQLTYIMYDPCLHAFSQCVCVVIRLSLVYKASAQVSAQFQVCPHFLPAHMADAPCWGHKRARYQHECTRRTSCCCCCCCFLCVSVHVVAEPFRHVL